MEDSTDGAEGGKVPWVGHVVEDYAEYFKGKDGCEVGVSMGTELDEMIHVGCRCFGGGLVMMFRGYAYGSKR